MLERGLERAESALRMSDRPAPSARAADRQERLEERDELLDDERLEARRWRRVLLRVSALRVARVPVRPEAVHVGGRAEAAGKRAIVRRDEDEGQLLRGNPRVG